MSGASYYNPIAQKTPPSKKEDGVLVSTGVFFIGQQGMSETEGVVEYAAVSGGHGFQTAIMLLD